MSFNELNCRESAENETGRPLELIGTRVTSVWHRRDQLSHYADQCAGEAHDSRFTMIARHGSFDPRAGPPPVTVLLVATTLASQQRLPAAVEEIPSHTQLSPGHCPSLSRSRPHISAPATTDRRRVPCRMKAVCYGSARGIDLESVGPRSPSAQAGLLLEPSGGRDHLW